ncbi:MAG: ABC transporter ATP-binding protein [Saprospiraceae bacterium]|nr:ABC transporter ATP-binding protein [Saprospiraceae bacterium]
MSEKKKSFDSQVLWRILKLGFPYPVLYGVCLVLVLVMSPLGSFRPLLIQRMIDQHVMTNDGPGMLRMTLLIFALLIVEVFLKYVFNYSTSRLAQNVVKDLRNRVFQKILSLKLQYFDKTPIGNLNTRTISDIETINSVFSQGAITILADLISIIAVLVIMFTNSYRLTLICLLTMPLMIFSTYVFKEKVKESFQRVRTQIANMNAYLQERISGMKIVHLFNAQTQEWDNFAKINKSYNKANIDSILYYSIFFPVVEIISAMTLGLMVWWGARGVVDESISVGALIAFPEFVAMLFRPMRMLADKFNSLQMGMVASERVFALLDDQDDNEPQGAKTITDTLDHIEFQNVEFSYNDQNKVLKGINLELKPNTSLAIVGSTGSGKSSIINVLMRFYPIQAGDILCNGISINELDPHDLRSKFSLVLQDVFLFSGSIFENIRMMDSRITLSDVQRSAKDLGLHEFIETLPNGYHFEVMERGNNLSMGQRQFIAFIRAMVFMPDILILDEATSSIDNESEQAIQKAIEKLLDNRTSIIIAHRLSTIRRADQIIVLQDGEILEQGSHDELMAMELGHYREMIEKQSSDALNPILL